MTLISFFDEDPVDNIGDLLFFRAERCIFVGPDVVMRKRRRRNLTEFVQERGLETELIFRSVPNDDLEEAVAVLRDLVMEYQNSVFDVTGGTELLLAAAGIITGNYDIPMYQRRGRTGQVLWQYGCCMEPVEAALTIREAAKLHSAKVFDSDIFPRWDMNEQLRCDVTALWDIAKHNASAWNNTCDALAALADETVGDDRLHVAVVSQSGRDAALRLDEGILAELMLGGFILDFDGFGNDWGGIAFRFRDETILRILTKAGNLLELYTCLAADWADDRDVGVPLDWDGVILPYGETDTRNELDVMLTVGVTPVCISCKNGICTKDALYELETIANHFGGRYARKVLVATFVHHNENSRKSLIQRAKDMGITLIADVDQISMEELSSRLCETVRDLIVTRN